MSLSKSFAQAQILLRNFFGSSATYRATIDTCFGTAYNAVALQNLQQEIQERGLAGFAKVEVLPQIQMGEALGAYAKETDTIYLSDQFVEGASQEHLVAVLLEEIGHAIDARINAEEAPGDEGAIFSALVRGIQLTGQQLASLRAENDWFALNLGDRWVAAEAATIVVDTLADENDGAGTGGVSLRDAIAASANGDTITFSANLQGQTITLTNGQLLINKSITIDGDLDGNSNTRDITVSGGNASRVFLVDDSNSGNFTTVTLNGLTITNGSVTGYGGAIFNAENLTITGSTISNSRATGFGGGIRTVDNTTLTLIDSIVSGNSANITGGISTNNNLGIAINIINSTVSNNSNTGTFGVGGMFVAGTINISGSTISGNSANGSHGGIYIAANTTATITNSTISGNSATGSNAGIFSQGNTTITNSTITDNSAGLAGGGLRVGGGVTTIQSTIISGNTAGGVGDEIYRSGSGSIGLVSSLIGSSAISTADALQGVTAGSSVITATSDGTNPTALSAILTPTLSDNGGITLTHALVAGSPAIDAGTNPTGATTDQRGTGFARVLGTAADIGAYEAGNNPPYLNVTAFNLAENTTDVSVVAIDPEGQPLTYSITGSGADDALFSIDPTTGVLSFNTAPDFEAPTDAGADNIYNVQISVTDGANPVTQDLAITVTDVNDTPVLTGGSSFSVAENITAVGIVAATSPISATLSYSLTGSGADDALFSIDPITGALSFNTAPDFEAPTDAGANNIYDVQVAITDGTNLLTQDLAITVTDDPSDNSSGTSGTSGIGIDLDKTQEPAGTIALVGATALSFILTTNQTSFVNELVAFQVQDGSGSVLDSSGALVSPSDPGYLQAILSSSKTQVVFSNTNASDAGPSGFTAPATHEITFDDNIQLGFLLVVNGTLDELEANPTGLQYFISTLAAGELDALSEGQFILRFGEDGGSGGLEFTVGVGASDKLLNEVSEHVKVGRYLNIAGDRIEALDLRGSDLTFDFDGDGVADNVTGKTLQVQVTLYREALFDNLIGFYVIDEDGTVNGVSPSDRQAYAQAAYNSRVGEISAPGNQSTITTTFSFIGGQLLVPFIISDGTTPNADYSDIYFPFLGANSDGADHVRLLGNGVFGLEDLPNGGDKDFDDVIVQVKQITLA